MQGKKLKKLKANKEQMVIQIQVRVVHYVHNETSNGGHTPLYPGKAGKSSF